MFMLHGRLGAKPGKRDQLLKILTDGETAAPIPGCRLYVIAIDETDDEGVWVTEIWESESDHTASLQRDEVRERIAQAMALVDVSGRRKQRLDALTGIPE
ncbi:antibiotic biosynthesis monooxygenase family protein [Nocardia sp. NPDC050712]|uniref:putative quinol monooxygenase n=1 Tax=Nocardia sp. NPDC050712 TaxID=3155518 RepID=UPI0033E0993D